MTTTLESAEREQAAASRGSSAPRALSASRAPGVSFTSAWFTPLFLLSLTALACVTRFAYLERPALWNDEARTFMRICGSYEDMLQFLRSDGFGPLHYEIDWVLAQRFHMTPFVMRVWPAVTGILMVPAMYLLAFELLGRRVARLTALLTLCSAFFMAYSRDAKMYMPLWFFMTLHLGCLLWWMRTGRATAWLSFVAAGCMAAGMHATGPTILCLDLLIGLTGANVTWRRSALLVSGMLLIAAGSIGYALSFNRMNENIDRAGWGATGIDWVSGRTDGHDGSALTADSAGCYLFAFSWIDEEKVRVHTPPKIMAAGAAMLGVLAATLAAGAIPWRARRRQAASSSSINCASPIASGAAPGLQSWRATLWLALWCLLPVYAFYRVTVPIAAIWTDWAERLSHTLVDHHLYLWMIAGFAVAGVLACFRWTRAALAVLAALLLVWSVSFPVAQAVLLDSFSTLPAPSWLWLHPLAPITAIALIPAVAWSGSSLPVRRRLMWVVGLIVTVAVVLGLFEVIDGALKGMEVHPVWMPRYLGFIAPAMTIAAAALLLRLPFAALRWTIIGLLIAVNLAQAGAHLFVSTEPVVDKMAADVITAMNSDGATLAFTPNTSPEFGPNTAGSIIDFVGAYYLFVQSNKPVTPEEFWRRNTIRWEFALRLESDAYGIASAAQSDPRVRRLLVWDGIDNGESPRPEDVLPHLGSGWRLASQEMYPVRMYLDWGQLYTNRRRVYER